MIRQTWQETFNFIVSIVSADVLSLFTDMLNTGPCLHYSDITMGPMVSQITGNSTVCSTVCSGSHQTVSIDHWWIPLTKASDAEKVSIW